MEKSGSLKKGISAETPGPTPTAARTNEAAESAGDAETAAILGQLTQTLRKYSAEEQRVPKSLQELVAAGYLPAVPAAPNGKRFEINEKRVEVILAE
jgi:competence protein ComGC